MYVEIGIIARFLEPDKTYILIFTGISKASELAKEKGSMIHFLVES